MPLDCPACGKTYVSASRYYTAHVSKCSGGVRAATPSPASPARPLAPAARAAPAAASLAAPRTGPARRAARLAASTLAIVAVAAYALVALAVTFPDQQALLICVNWAPALLPWLLGDSFAYPVYGIGLAASDPAVDTFELAAGMLLPEGGQAMYATQVLQRVVADLERRRSNGADAPPAGKPASRKAKRGEQVVICSTPQHRIVLADCLGDAFVAFTSTSAEAKAAQAAFKPKVARSNMAAGGANAAEE